MKQFRIFSLFLLPLLFVSMTAFGLNTNGAMEDDNLTGRGLIITIVFFGLFWWFQRDKPKKKEHTSEHEDKPAPNAKTLLADAVPQVPQLKPIPQETTPVTKQKFDSNRSFVCAFCKKTFLPFKANDLGVWCTHCVRLNRWGEDQTK